MTLDPPPTWTLSALCAQSDPDAWFPEGQEDFDAPMRICRRCTVRAECLDLAMSIESKAPHHRGRYGIWGGLSPRQRHNLANKKGAAA